MIDDNTFKEELDPYQNIEEYGNSRIIALFLDFLMTSAIEEPNSLISYTSKMSQETKKLLTGVTLEQN